MAAPHLPHLVPVRDSKRPAGPVIGFGRGAWRAFVRELGQPSRSRVRG
ncbi:DUF397 domain-containing protein [Streptomyces atratus]|nr:DUF397 domain-containing protein [Streptomyces atratus]